jgi:hypothetical protein
VPEEKNPVDQVLDLLVFAPLGLAMTARTQLPEMVAKGRSQVEGQLSMARFIGQFAVQQGKVEVEKRLKTYTAPAPRSAPPPPAAPTEPAPAPTMSMPVTVRAEPAPAFVDLPPDDDLELEDLDPVTPEDRAPGSPPAAADLAIPGYDALSASQVVQRLAGLSPAELEQVRLYETSTRGRKTVLTKISQLQ